MRRHRRTACIGGAIEINARTGCGGVVETELRERTADRSSEPVPGFTFDECVPFRGDEVRAPCRWRGIDDLSALRDKHLELHFRLHQAGPPCFYPHRASRCHCNHRDSGVPAAAGTAPNGDGGEPVGQIMYGTHGEAASAGYDDWARVGRWRHGVGGNYVFVDGHVEAIGALQIANQNKYWRSWW